jgi:glycosyltransferase involved in cell wall biosynthesis
VDVGRKYGARCIENPWSGYRNQKNFALLSCTQEWILSLDADEVLSDELHASICTFFTYQSHSKFDGLSFNRCSFFMGKWIKNGDWYPDKKLRIIKRGKGNWVGGDLHEYLNLKGAIFHLSGDLLHYSYDSILDFPKKAITYSSVFADCNNLQNAKKAKNKIWIRSIWRFFRGYFLRMGFLDGVPGFIIAASAGYECLLKYGLLHESSKREY